MTPTIIAVFAVAEEVVPLSIPGWNVISVVTEIGKTQAAMRLTKAILEHQPQCVINLGTAGTLRHRVGDVLLSREYIDRDFQQIQLPGVGFHLQNTFPLPQAIHEIYLRMQQVATIPLAVVSTGDNFVTDAAHLSEDMVDMEGYALASVCQEFGVPLFSVKYITDIIGQNSVEDWAAKLEHARARLTQFLDQTIGNLPTNTTNL